MDSNSIIPSMLAVRLSEEPDLEEGETHPVKIECVKESDLLDSDTYIVKFFNNVAHGGFGIVSELIAGSLARYFDIPVPDFGLVTITGEFVDAAYSNTNTPAPILTSLNQNKDEINFGSKYLTGGIQNPLGGTNHSYDQKMRALRIFLFDALIYNADRTLQAPNLFEYKETYYVFDHEKAFHFLFRKPPLAGADFFAFPGRNSGSFLAEHLFRDMLYNQGFLFDDFIAKLKDLSDNKITTITELIPDLLKVRFSSQIEEIKKYLAFMRENHIDFKFGVKRVLL